VRVLAFGVHNTPKTSFSVNGNAWFLFHPPNVRLPNEIEEVPTDEPDMIEGEVEDPSVPSTWHGSKQNLQYVNVEHRHVDPASPGRLRYPTPAPGYRKYPMYTPGGLDRRWVNEFELGRSDVKWVGILMCEISLSKLVEEWH